MLNEKLGTGKFNRELVSLLISWVQCDRSKSEVCVSQRLELIDCANHVQGLGSVVEELIQVSCLEELQTSRGFMWLILAMNFIGEMLKDTIHVTRLT